MDLRRVLVVDVGDLTCVRLFYKESARASRHASLPTYRTAARVEKRERTKNSTTATALTTDDGHAGTKEQEEVDSVDAGRLTTHKKVKNTERQWRVNEPSARHRYATTSLHSVLTGKTADCRLGAGDDEGRGGGSDGPVNIKGDHKMNIHAAPLQKSDGRGHVNSSSDGFWEQIQVVADATKKRPNRFYHKSSKRAKEKAKGKGQQKWAPAVRKRRAKRRRSTSMRQIAKKSSVVAAVTKRYVSPQAGDFLDEAWQKIYKSLAKGYIHETRSHFRLRPHLDSLVGRLLSRRY